MLARDVMVSPVITASKTATVREIAKILLEKRISAVPVVDHAGKVVGIITESDLMRRAEAGTEHPYSWWVHFLAGDATIAADYVKSHAARAEDVMTPDVVTATPETPLHELATLLEEHRIRRVPIVDKAGNLVGIVSRANLIQVVASARPKLEMTLSDYTIRQKLLDELKKQSWTHMYNLNVTVTRGVVDLWGYAQSDEERKAIRVAAEGIPGVTAVNDHLADSPVFAY
ncbi:MAG: CBS domain-containing protein [Bradyrhizobium sp.]|uniref:CBS domain-containing protein n=1 Tax=Bradyrhizobium sp. TaxID=376 RepID=UPI0011F7355F|nr:CBS domain-containing protein [Bradyrhizobium sp.]THD70466.1 MAG: CBS domain-containing protein [Bradyrhizobium sp.]